MGAGETRCGFSGRFQALPWPLVAPRHRHTFLLRVALLLLGFSYINDRRRRRFSFSPSLPTSSPVGEIHHRPAITALSISPKASPRSYASPELAHSRLNSQRALPAIVPLSFGNVPPRSTSSCQPPPLPLHACWLLCCIRGELLMLLVLSIVACLACLAGAAGTATPGPPWPMRCFLRGVCDHVRCLGKFEGSCWLRWSG
jgi:hypothetical protein